MSQDMDQMKYLKKLRVSVPNKKLRV